MNTIKTMLAAAVLGLGTLGTNTALADDWSVDFRINSGSPDSVWVEPVYETRCERVWVEPVYESRCERVWVEPVYETSCDPVWVPDRIEMRQVRDVDRFGNISYHYEQVLVEPGHWTKGERKVLIRNGYYDTVEKRVCVREGYWSNVDKLVCVRDGYWATTRSGMDVRVDHGDVYADRARHVDRDADDYRRDRDRDQQAKIDHLSRDDRSRSSRDRDARSDRGDRGDRYR